MNRLHTFFISGIITVGFALSCALAQDDRSAFQGKWSQSEIYYTNDFNAFDSTKFVFNDWTFYFDDKGKFLENSTIQCGQKKIAIKGKWYYEDKFLHIKRNVRCIRWSKEYNYGRDLIGEVVWVSPTLWYVLVGSDTSSIERLAIIAYKKV